jgi:hypothetical protein
MYQLTVDNSTGQHHQAEAGTGDEILEFLRDQLARHLVSGPVSWAITSPWDEQHLGRIRLNGKVTDLKSYLAEALCGPDSIRESLAREFYQQHQLPDRGRE